MAAVLLRRLFTNTFEDFWPGLGAEVHGVVKQELLLAVQNDAVDSVRRKICDALAELARNLFDENGNNLWPEVLKFLFELASSENPALRQSAFHVFGAVPGIFGNQQGLYIDVIKQMLSRLIFCLFSGSCQTFSDTESAAFGPESALLPQICFVKAQISFQAQNLKVL